MDSNTTVTSKAWVKIKTLTNQLFSKSFDLTPLDPILNNHSGLDHYALTSNQFSSIQSWLNAIVYEANATVERLSNTSQVGSGVNSNISQIINDVNTTNPEDDANHSNLTSKLDLYIGGYAILITAFIGLFLNTAGIYRLSRREGYRNILINLRIVNLILDTIYLAFQIIRSVVFHFASFSSPLSATYYILTNSGERFVYISSVLTFVALAHAQYKIVTNPFQGRRMSISWRITRRQLMKYLLPTTLLSICFTFPITLEIDTEMIPSSEEKLLRVIPSDLRLNPYYSAFLMFTLNLVLLGLFPFLSLLYFAYHMRNSLNQRCSFTESNDYDKMTRSLFIIIFTFIFTIFLISGLNFQILILFPFTILLYLTYHSLHSLNQIYLLTGMKLNSDTLTINGRQRNSNKAAKIVIFQIITFICLHVLRFLLSVGEFTFLVGKNKSSNYELQHDHGIPTSLQILSILSNFCMSINASVNYLIYLYLNSTTTFIQHLLAWMPHFFRQRSSLRENDIEMVD